MILKHSANTSLESQLKNVATLIIVGLFVLTTAVMLLLSWSNLVIITVLIFLVLPIAIALWTFFNGIITPFYSLTSQVEAIKLEDYAQHARVPYNSGILSHLTQEITALSNDLQQRKLQYDQHTLLIYHLIEQLNAPIAIFNQKLQLSHANSAFSKHIGQPWQSQRLSASKHLGLVLADNKQWHFSDDNASLQWQIKQSQFTQDEQTYHLVILSDVEKLLRKNQQESWQQIIRVLSHEIRNSLTPIKSLAQTLAELPSTEPKSKEALNVIVERSVGLQNFVNQYSDISKKLVLNKAWVETNALLASVKNLFPAVQLATHIETDKIWGDATLIEQVLINLIKNAIEASSTTTDNAITLNIFSAVNNAQQDEFIIEVIDSGQGIANPSNLFVPFYTTKKNGQGIGLGLCQNIIEQHDGRLTLENNKTTVGAIARVVLPTKASS
ncbi:PAS domain-containing sensor histidine kinase [Colwelliaceae bacterium 6471]